MRVMRKLSFLPAFLGALPLLAAAPASQNYEAAMKRYVAFPAELVPVLASAKDGKSAEAAAPKLEALLPRLFELRETIKRLPVPEADEAKTLESTYGLAMRKKWGEVFDQIYRLQAVGCYDSESFRKSFATMCLILR